MSRWLVTGAAGMLGWDMGLALRRHGEPVTALDRHELDITDPAAVAGHLGAHKPDVVVNCAAWTAVDAAEGEEAQALAVNGTGAANLAAACARHGARLVQVSTDYVFAGDQPGGYAEDDEPAPVNAYGRTKLAGERAALGPAPVTWCGRPGCTEPTGRTSSARGQLSANVSSKLLIFDGAVPTASPLYDSP